MLLGAVILGVGLVVGFCLVGQWFVNASPAAVTKALKRTGVVLALLVIIALAATGRLGWAMAALAGLAPWAGRIFRLLMVGQVMRRMGLFGGPTGFHTPGGGGSGFGFGAAGGNTGQQAGAGTSEVVTEHLRMRLHHASGRMSGEVLRGVYAGRHLDDLGSMERLDLWRQVRDDPDSARVYEAWLDRHEPHWRDRAAGGGESSEGRGAAGRSGDVMTRTEALHVLGLEEGASVDDIKRAYRRVMAKAHPDHGGSSWMAAKVNEAKRVLLDE